MFVDRKDVRNCALLKSLHKERVVFAIKLFQAFMDTSYG